MSTGLHFPTLARCLQAETEMRAAWANHWNAAKKDGSSEGTLEMIRGQFTSGTCVPNK